LCQADGRAARWVDQGHRQEEPDRVWRERDQPEAECQEHCPGEDGATLGATVAEDADQRLEGQGGELTDREQ
jgi:hypothetical protein